MTQDKEFFHEQAVNLQKVADAVKSVKTDNSQLHKLMKETNARTVKMNARLDTFKTMLEESDASIDRVRVRSLSWLLLCA
jgi:septal ring factor EnvC (AmiA/AmiB activator)